jgi:general secretion pathway protein A
MYQRHFGFTVKPFAMTPDPAFLYVSRRHAMAMTMLEYSLESQAPFSVLTGEIGSGKTTLVRKLLRQLGDGVKVGLITHTHSRFQSIHGWVLAALGSVPGNESDISLYEAMVNLLKRQSAKGGRTLLIIDEAHNLPIEVLEELRLLSNVNAERDLLLQILLVGQTELRVKLGRPELRQFAQRISVFYDLKRLDRDETHAYVQHRLKVAGGNPSIFHPDAIDLVYTRTRGVPRLVNLICDFALVYAFAERKLDVDAELVTRLVRDCTGGIAFPTHSAADPDVPVGMTTSSAA